MPKRRKDLQVRGEDVRRWIRKGRLSAFPAGANRVLRVHRAFRATLPPVKMHDRKNNRRRMTISAGSFLNSRWIKVNKTWDIWPDTQSAKTLEEVAELKARSIIQVWGVWYIQIYEVVSGVNKLRRQRVKIRVSYYQEKTRRAVIMDSIEREIARDAAGVIKLSPAERQSLLVLTRQIELRLQDIDVIGGQLSAREVFAYAGGWAELGLLRRVKRSIEEATKQTLVQSFSPNFNRYLERLADNLGGIVNLDVRHDRFWAQFHIRRAAEVLTVGPQEKCYYYLGKAVEYLNKTVETLQGWADSLSEEESRHVISA